MFNMSDLLGVLSQSGLTRSSHDRMRNALGAGGSASDSLLSELSGQSGGGGSGIGNMLGNVLQEAGRAVGGNRNLAVGGIGALAGALFGGGGRSMGGALGGGLLALLGAMGYSALKKGGQPASDLPTGLQEVKTPEEKQVLEREAGLILQAMINAVKADGRIDQGEIDRIIGKLDQMGIDSEAKAFVMDELRKPMNTDTLVNGAAGNTALGAQLYAASLLAIEVDTPAEQDYLKDLAQRLGLLPDTVDALEQTIGMQR